MKVNVSIVCEKLTHPEFDVEFDALFDAFWTNDHPIWEECKVMNDLSEFSASPFENKTRKFNFKVKMGVPFGPSHAPVEVHIFLPFNCLQFIFQITQTLLEDDRKNGRIICENTHKTDYPYADTFDIVHRYKSYDSLIYKLQYKDTSL